MVSRSHARAVAAILALSVVAAAQEPDRDGDGLSDFHEKHKYLTDPAKRDSDGDGVPDGDWRERREYQYVVRTVVQVMRPVTIDYLCDDYQDARILDESKTYVELEIIHYPFNSVASTIVADPEWRRTAAKMKEWTKPGTTADWSPALRDAMTIELKSDDLDDKTLVERTSKWLLERAAYHDGFTTFATAFDDKGKPFMPDGSRPEQVWQREISARGMFENKTRGSCSSSAIYLNGCLRALGVPTRIVLVIPVVDANDDAELQLVRRGLSHHGVRKMVSGAVRTLKGSWTSHTFNEVFVGKRWRRLNYDKLGQESLDKNLFGLSTHVATFNDWADARMWETIGKRQATQSQDDVFGGPNPYSTISLRDEFGPHCKLENPLPEPLAAKLTTLLAPEDPALPQEIRDWFATRGVRGLIARVEGLENGDALADFLEAADLRLEVKGATASTLPSLEPGCWWWKQDHALVLLRWESLDKGTFAVTPKNESQAARWETAPGLGFTR